MSQMSQHACSSQGQQTESKGLVVAIEAGDVWVQLASGGCGRCHEPGGCGGQSLTQMLGPEKKYRVANLIGAQVGDRVVLLLDSGVVRQAAWLAYGLPLLLCLLGAVIGQFLSGDGLAFVGALLGLFVAWKVLRKQTQQALGHEQVRPQLSIRFDHSS